MLKENKRTWIITNIVVVLPVLIGVIFWNRLPDVMATHFGMNNAANGFSNKAVAVFGLPVFLLVVHWLCAFATACDPKKQNISSKMYRLVLWIAPGRCSCNVSDEPGISNGHYILYGTVCRYIVCRDWKLPAKSKTELHHRNQNSMDACK